MDETRNPNPPTQSDHPFAEEATANAPPAVEVPAEPISVDELLNLSEPGEGETQVDLARAASILESLLLVSGEPLSFDKVGQLLGGLSKAEVREVLGILRTKYPADVSGILVEEVARGLQLRTNPANQEHVRKLFDTKPPRFSRAALETLAIIAYKQPLTRQEVEQIRGVDCAGSIRTLMDRRLIKVVGKKDVPGKPFLFSTTREFMEVFGLGALSDLPSMREIEEFLAASTATPVEGARPGLYDATPWVVAAETPRDELVESLEGTASAGEGVLPPEGGIPGDVSDADLVEAASKEAGEGNGPADGD